MAVKKSTTAAKAKNLTAARKNAMAEKVINKSGLKTNAVDVALASLMRSVIVFEERNELANRAVKDVRKCMEDYSNARLNACSFKVGDRVTVYVKGIIEECTIAGRYLNYPASENTFNVHKLHELEKLPIRFSVFVVEAGRAIGEAFHITEHDILRRYEV